MTIFGITDSLLYIIFNNEAAQLGKTRFEYTKPLDNQDASALLSGPILVDMRNDDVFSRISLTDLGVFAQTSQKAESETAFLRLLAASINAAPECLDAKEDATALASIAILKKHPELLFRKKQVTDHYGREIWASPYQLFLGAGDVWALRQIQSDIFPLIENGEAKIQFKEQFPSCPWPLPENFCEEMLYDDRNKQQIKAIVGQLAAVKLLIEADPFTNEEPLDVTKHAVDVLCKLFQPTPGEVIRSGLHFPPAIINEVYNTFTALQYYRSFFTLAVMKPALDALPTVDGQCCQSGLNNLDMEIGPNRRCHSSYKHPLGKPLTLKFVNDTNKRGAPAVVDPYDGDVLFASKTYPGYLDCYNKNGARRIGVCTWIAPMLFWKTYEAQKQQLMGAITRNLYDHNQSMRCVIL